MSETVSPQAPSELPRDPGRTNPYQSPKAPPQLPTPPNATGKVPLRGWVVTFAGMMVNLCLGILYAWSVWKKQLIAPKDHAEWVGQGMTGLNEGWTYLTNSQSTWAYSICGIVFALCMIPGGRVQDRFGPRWGATASGLLLGSGCILAGLMKSYLGLILGFGLLGGIGMGLGYAAATPAAVKWFGPHRRGLIVGLVVAGFGGAAIYIAPLAEYLIAAYGLSGSFIGLGCLFAVVIIAAGQLLSEPPPGYVPPGPKTLPDDPVAVPAPIDANWTAGKMIGTWQFYVLVLMFVGSAQSGLLVIGNAAPLLKDAGKHIQLFANNAWLLAAYGGFVNAAGRIGTGIYSDKLGRLRAYWINGLVSAVCLAATPWIMQQNNPWLLFVAVGVAYWQYGGGLALMPAMTADYFGAKDLGLKYGLVFLGWGLAFLMPLAAGYLTDSYKNYEPNPDYGLYLAFYISTGLLLSTVVLSLFMRRPQLIS